MRKVMVVLVATTVVLAASAVPSQADGWHGHPGWHGGWHPGWHGPRVFVRGPLFWGPRFVVGPPVYVAPPIYYAPDPVAVQQPPVYVQPPQYWYYCQNPAGYYPSVPQCPGGWMQVAPQSQ
jgi:hypothetical protein